MKSFPALPQVKVACFALLVGGSALSQPTATPPTVHGPELPNDCLTAASHYHAVNPWVMRAIVKNESNFNPKALNKNSDGSIDVGIAQFNSKNFAELRKFGIAPDDLMDGCVSSYVAAWHLRKKIDTYGNTWFAIGAYHSTTPCYNSRYTALIWNTLIKWRVLEGAPLQVPTIRACDPKRSQAVTNADQGSVLAFDQP